MRESRFNFNQKAAGSFFGGRNVCSTRSTHRGPFLSHCGPHIPPSCHN